MKFKKYSACAHYWCTFAEHFFCIQVMGCCNKVSTSQLVRPAVKIPFMAVCEVHRRRLKHHQCCPGCGHFCTQVTDYFATVSKQYWKNSDAWIILYDTIIDFCSGEYDIIGEGVSVLKPKLDTRATSAGEWVFSALNTQSILFYPRWWLILSPKIIEGVCQIRDLKLDVLTAIILKNYPVAVKQKLLIHD